MTAEQPWYGAIVQRQLQLLDWTQNDLASEVGVSTKHLSQLLHGRSRMSVDMLERILDAVHLRLAITVLHPDE